VYNEQRRDLLIESADRLATVVINSLNIRTNDVSMNLTDGEAAVINSLATTITAFVELARELK
jgi:hypothetical protein